MRLSSQARAARDRVLKNRAAHSHLSTRTEVTVLCSHESVHTNLARDGRVVRMRIARARTGVAAEVRQQVQDCCSRNRRRSARFPVAAKLSGTSRDQQRLYHCFDDGPPSSVPPPSPCRRSSPREVAPGADLRIRHRLTGETDALLPLARERVRSWEPSHNRRRLTWLPPDQSFRCCRK